MAWFQILAESMHDTGPLKTLQTWWQSVKGMAETEVTMFSMNASGHIHKHRQLPVTVYQSHLTYMTVARILVGGNGAVLGENLHLFAGLVVTKAQGAMVQAGTSTAAPDHQQLTDQHMESTRNTCISIPGPL